MKNATIVNGNYNFLLIVLSALLVLSIYSAQFLTYKEVAIGRYVMSAGTFLVPFYYLLGDMITELFGFRMTRKLIWLSLICTFLFSALVQGLSCLPPPLGWHYQQDFSYVFGHLIRISVADFIGIFAGGFVNSIAISKWKVLVRGRYYWWRSLTSSFVGQLVYIVLAVPLMLYGAVSNLHLMEIMLASLIVKSILIVVAVLPVSFLVGVIKVTQHLDVYDHGVNYNPFKM